MKKRCIFISFCLVFMLCGCTGYREIDRGYLVTAIGFADKTDNTTVFIEALSSSDVTDKKSERVVFTGAGKDVLQAYECLKNKLVKPLYFEQLGAVVFEGKIDANLNFVKKIPNINYGVYLVKTDDLKPLFENDMPSGVLGYDVIALVKTQEKGQRMKNQLYKVKSNQEMLPKVNFIDGNLILKGVVEK